MFLKRLELQGFKSFPEKVKLEFKEGITAVVGPNGSGKSNISDAIRWVLGEQSAKSLRGDKMEDIIFNGTNNRKPLGFAEVSMIMDNVDQKLNIEYSEVTVTRRVYRSGESGFFINGSACRLKDIHELFMDTGVGREGYSIIGQGRIDSILSNKSEDRRALFEEAVGIVKYKTRRQQAESKLNDVRQNLVRTNDIIVELENQVTPLEKQAEKTKKYLDLAEKLKDARLNIFVYEYEKTEKETEATLENIKIIEENISSESSREEEIQKDKEVLRSQLSSIEEQYSANNENMAEMRSRAEASENELKIINNSIEYINSDILKLENEIVKNENLCTNKSEEIALAETKSQALELTLASKNNALSKAIEEYESLNTRTSENEEVLKQYNFQLIEKMQGLNSIKASLQEYKFTLNSLMEKNNSVDEEIFVLRSRAEEREVSIQAIKLNESEILEKENALNVSLGKLDNELNSVKQYLNEIKTSRELLNRKLNENKSKYKVLSELEREYDGYNNSVKAILKQKQTNPAFINVKGAVGELIKVESRLETAIEIALGQAVQNVVTIDEYAAKACMEYLKVNKKGRATFLPMSTIRPKGIGGDKGNILKEKNVIGIADELVQYEPAYKNVISSILGRIIIVKDIDTALELSRKYNQAYRIVTLDGEVINAGGSMTGGSVYKKSGGIFSRSREINELKENIEKLQEEAEFTDNQIFAKENIRKEILIDVEKKKNKLHELEIHKKDLSVRLEQAQLLVEETKSKINSLQEGKISDSSKISDVQNSIYEFELKEKELDDEVIKINNKLESFQTKIQDERETKEEHINKTNDLKLAINKIEHELSSSETDKIRLQSEIDNLKKEIEELNQEIGTKNNERILKFNQIEEIKQKVVEFKALYAEFQEKSREISSEKSNVTAKSEQITTALLEVGQTISKLSNEKTRLEGKKENLELKNQQLCDSIWEDYEVTYAQAYKVKDEGINYVVIKGREKELKSEISKLGNINVNAVEEYKAVKERLDFNLKHREDIVKADEDLKIIIEKLTEDMQTQFQDQFKLINENFKNVFSEIFGGGTASLKLVDEENILTSAIDIVAKPPGKSLQTLSLLSGGERTLTAMSLLFSIFKLKPSPFCVLDETDAALDDANVRRYADYIKKLSEENQFILITHKTGTMEVADILYGVTMQEQGVSKIISVALEDAAAN